MNWFHNTKQLYDGSTSQFRWDRHCYQHTDPLDKWIEMLVDEQLKIIFKCNNSFVKYGKAFRILLTNDTIKYLKAHKNRQNDNQKLNEHNSDIDHK